MRILRPDRRFRASRDLHARTGTPEGRAVKRILLELEDDALPLPGPNDREVVIPPSRRCMARPILSAGLLVCYSVQGDIVTLLGVMRIA